MKQLALISIFALLTSFSFANNNGNEDESENTEINQKIDGKKEGRWEIYYNDGSLKQEGNFVNGRRDGMWKFYSKDGEFYDLGRLDMGKKTGWWYLVKTDTGKKLEALLFDGRGNTIGYKNLQAEANTTD